MAEKSRDHPSTFSPTSHILTLKECSSEGLSPGFQAWLTTSFLGTSQPVPPSTAACPSEHPTCVSCRHETDKSDREALSPLLAHPRGWNLSRHTPGLDLKTCVLHALIAFPIQTPRPLPQAGQNHLCLAHTGALINGSDGHVGACLSAEVSIFPARP